MHPTLLLSGLSALFLSTPTHAIPTSHYSTPHRSSSSTLTPHPAKLPTPPTPSIPASSQTAHLHIIDSYIQQLLAQTGSKASNVKSARGKREVKKGLLDDILAEAMKKNKGKGKNKGDHEKEKGIDLFSAIFAAWLHKHKKGGEIESLDPSVVAAAAAVAMDMALEDEVASVDGEGGDADRGIDAAVFAAAIAVAIEKAAGREVVAVNGTNARVKEHIDPGVLAAAVAVAIEKAAGQEVVSITGTKVDVEKSS